MVSTTGMVVSLKTDLRFPESGQQGHGAQIIQEYLATNLFDSTITQSMFQELYFYRWPVELKYKELKSRLAIEEFSGATTTSVLVRHFLNPLMNSIANFFPLNAWKLNIILSSPTTIVQQIHIII